MTDYFSIRDPEVGRLIKQRSRFADRSSGYASMIFGLPFVETEQTKTMATDGKYLYFNRIFIRNTPDHELLGVLMHEALHVSLGHHLRRGNTHPTLWNVGCDYVGNLIVKDAGIKLPENALLDERYRGMTAEQVVRALSRDEDEQGKGEKSEGEKGEGEKSEGEKSEGEKSESEESESEGGGGCFPLPCEDGDGDGEGSDGEESDGEESDGEGSDGEDDDLPSGAPKGFDPAGEIWDATDDDGNPLDGKERADAEEELKRDLIVADAVERASGTGTVTIDGGVLDQAKSASVDWVEALADFLDQAFGSEPTLAKPAPRHLWTENYFPSYQGVGGGDLVIAIDTSASISQAEAQAFADEIDSIRENIKPDRTIVIYCDTTIQRNAAGEQFDEFDNGEDIVVRRINGGGTRFDPPFSLVEQEGFEPSAFIYFTDGWCRVGSGTAAKANYPVLWATTGVEPTFIEGEEFGEIIEVSL